MSSTKTVKNVFSSGEISPRGEGRYDASQYENAVRQMNNMLIKKLGGAFKRQGTQFVAEALDHIYRSRTETFQIDTENTYTIEYSNLKARPIQDGGVLTETPISISNITQANPAIITATAHSLTAGDYFDVFDVAGMEEFNGRTLKAASVGTNLIKPSDVAGNLLDSTAYGAYTSGGTISKHVVFSHVYTADQLVDVQVAQIGDTLYSVHKDVAPQKLTRESDTSWTYEEFTTIDGPYLDQNTDESITLTPSNTTGSINVTASVDLFAASDVDRQISMTDAGVRGWGIITAFTDAQNVTVSLSSDLGSLNATPNWRLGAFSARTGYPRAITIHENRLWFGYIDGEYNTSLNANSKTERQSFWGSKINEYDTFSPTETDLTVLDTNGLKFTIGDGGFDAITWLRSGFGLFIGTAGGPYIATSSGGNITANNIQVTKQSGYGSNLLPPELINGSLIYVSRTGRSVRELIYNFEYNSYVSNDLSSISEHMFREGDKAIDTAFQRHPDGHFWYVMDSGELVCMLFDREQNVVGFNRHQLGGTFESATVTSGFLIEGNTYRIKNNIGGADFTSVGATDNNIGTEFEATGISPTWGSGELALLSDAVVEAVSASPSVGLTEDNIYMSVKRTINGNTRRYIEFLSDEFIPTHDRDYDDAIYLDSALTYSGSEVTEVGNLWHLEGETVRVLANNGDDTSYTVSNGKITLQDGATNVKVGLNYRAMIELLPLEVMSRYGNSVGGIKRIGEMFIKLENSMGFSHGKDLDELNVEPFRETTDYMNMPPPLFTGVKQVISDQVSSRDNGYYIVQDAPYPLNLLYIAADMEVE